MKNHSFMFIDSDFPVISNFCMRMEKNIVESDGVDAVIWAGKIAEHVTLYITRFISKDYSQLDQKTKLFNLYNNGNITKEIYDQLDSIRQYRNIATHDELKGEMGIAKKLHRYIFNILCYFYGTYLGDESYYSLAYPGITYQHDEEFLNQIKNNIYNNANTIRDSSHNASLNQQDVDYNVHKIFNQSNVYFNEDLKAYTAYFDFNDKQITIGHFKTREMAVKKGLNFVMGDDFKLFKYFKGCMIPEVLESGNYSDSKGIDFDMDEKLWTASFDGKSLGYFISQNSAIIARKEYIDTQPLPEPKNGSYSDYKEITFDLNHKLWCIKRDGVIIDYYDSEREAIHNLSKVLNLDIDLKDLGIVQDEKDLKWRVFYNNKYVTTCDTKKQAIKARLKHISEYAQPKRNSDGLYSIHKGINFDDKNLIWTLTIKGERLGYFDSEEDAFNYKKEFLRSKGFDVSELIFHKEESFDDSFEFKVRLNSDENAIQYSESAEEWIVYFRGIERGRCKSEDEAKKLRRKILREMPYPPKKSNGKYSFTEGIDYDINLHLWLAKNNDEIIGHFDSEEDAFYGLKEALVKEGVDVKDMHFINSDPSVIDKKDSDESDADDSKMTYYDVFKSSTGNYIYNESSDDDSSKSLGNDKADEEIDNADKSLNEMESKDKLNDSDKSLKEFGNVEEYKKSSFYGLAKKDNQDKVLENMSISDLEYADDEYSIDLDMDNIDLDRDNGFQKISENLFKSSNRKDLKEIKFNSYDSKNFRREIILSYNDSDLCISLEGMVNKDELKDILFLDLLDNMISLNYTKEDKEYFSIFVKLHYKLEVIDFKTLINVLSSLGWEFDLLGKFGVSGQEIDLPIKESSSSKASAIDKKEELSSKSSKSKDYLQTNPLSKTKTYSKSKVSKGKKSKLKSEKAIIRGGRRVSLEEANELDNALENKEIKSNIVDKRPETVKDFKTTSLNNILEAKAKEEERNDDDFDSIEEDMSVDYGDEMDYISESSMDDDFDSALINEESSQELDSSMDYGDVLEEDSFNSNESIEDIFDESEDLTDDESVEDDLTLDASDEEDLTYVGSDDSNIGETDDLSNNASIDLTVDDLFEDDSDSSFEDELDSIASSSQDSSSELSDLEINQNESDVVSELDAESDIQSDESELVSESESAEESNTEPESPTVSKKSKTKPKKVKKPKKIPADAFDEKYADSPEIEYDEEKDKWTAHIGGELIKSFDTPKEAYIERRKLIRRRVTKPKPGFNGKYSDEEGINFDIKEGLWTSSVNGIVVSYSIDEKNAIFKRAIFVDLILKKFNSSEEEFNEDLLKEIKATDFDEFFSTLTEDDLDDSSRLNFKEVKKELFKL